MTDRQAGGIRDKACAERKAGVMEVERIETGVISVGHRHTHTHRERERERDREKEKERISPVASG